MDSMKLEQGAWECLIGIDPSYDYSSFDICKEEIGSLAKGIYSLPQAKSILEQKPVMLKSVRFYMHDLLSIEECDFIITSFICKKYFPCAEEVVFENLPHLCPLSRSDFPWSAISLKYSWESFRADTKLLFPRNWKNVSQLKIRASKVYKFAMCDRCGPTTETQCRFEDLVSLSLSRNCSMAPLSFDCPKLREFSCHEGQMFDEVKAPLACTIRLLPDYSLEGPDHRFDHEKVFLSLPDVETVLLTFREMDPEGYDYGGEWTRWIVKRGLLAKVWLFIDCLDGRNIFPVMIPKAVDDDPNDELLFDLDDAENVKEKVDWQVQGALVLSIGKLSRDEDGKPRYTLISRKYLTMFSNDRSVLFPGKIPDTEDDGITNDPKEQHGIQECVRK